ncbi:hypothetical protein SNOG_15931 [Parastagonospora nodorum SN15]|uniref:Uncharacterized protein n=1 Tax=Phaeosphaeria nodorum (strain SN15 / ATCC MYA-4574 / FGSC 10173) TaxID=321614 RepID=Q0TXB6_PHANO|nr:hypothetical protein SNOG_15931 [Parastagonospora nodorum SN15]EAT76769.1 hypothetical protein SNOG_15931 [Parastagonospora nodorum SN15]
MSTATLMSKCDHIHRTKCFLQSTDTAAVKTIRSAACSEPARLHQTSHGATLIATPPPDPELDMFLAPNK